MRIFGNNPNVDKSDVTLYPGGRVKDQTDSEDGTPVDQRVYDDFHQMRMKLARRYGIIENDLPDNELNGYQFVDALKALPSKNDYVPALGGTAGLITISTKLSLFEAGEQIVCRASFDFTTGTFPVTTNIRGNNNVTLSASVKDRFRQNEYVRIIRTGSGVDIIRLVDSNNLDTVTSDKGYLKKATQAQEQAGDDTVATTPNTNAFIYALKTIGTASVNFLASQSRNGLMSIADKTKLDNIGSDVINKGFFGNVDVGAGSGTTYTVSGDIVSATVVESSGGRSRIRVVVSNTLGGLNYFVQTDIESTSASMFTDVEIQPIVFKPINGTTFDIALRETAGGAQALKIHIRTIKY